MSAESDQLGDLHFTPKTMKWINTVVVRPIANLCCNNLVQWPSNMNNLTQRVRRLGITNFSWDIALDMITHGTIPTILLIKKEAAKGLIRLKINDYRILMNGPMVNLKLEKEFTVHIILNDNIIETIPL